MKDTVILITRYGMGEGPAELMISLIRKYIHLLADLPDLPRAICFYTEGVKLVLDGSPVIKELQTLESRGVRLVVCNTCLDFYGHTGQINAGIVGGMTDIIEAQFMAGKVISI
ncbi:MAG: DsrE family protein [Chloroflexota bacterium]